MSNATPKTVDGMLVDGSNPEGVDPVPPLQWSSKEDLGSEVVIYGSAPSPPVSKIRYHLAFAGVKYRCVRRNPNTQPKGHYQKIPSIFANGRTVNDSFIIVKNLLPALYPRQGTNESLLIEWEEKITFGLQLAMEIETMEDPSSTADLLAIVGIPMPTIITAVFGCILPIGAPHRKIPVSIRKKRAQKDEKYGPLKTFREYLSEFEDGISDGNNLFFGSALSPGPVDISVYATMKPFYSVLHVKKTIEDAKLSAWWDRMDKIMPESVSQDKFEKA